MEQFVPLGTTRCIPQGKFPRKPYNKFVRFIDQACLVKMAGYWTRYFSANLANTHEISNTRFIALPNTYM